MDIVTYALLNGKIKDYASNVDEWLEENVDPATGYVLDRSLQMENAAAPADMVGDINDEVGDLKNTLNDYNITQANTQLWENGSIRVENGNNQGSDYQIRTKTYLKDSVLSIKSADGSNIKYFLYAYQNNADHTYVGVWRASTQTFIQDATSSLTSLDILKFRTDYPNYVFRVTAANPGEEISVSDASNIMITSKNVINNEEFSQGLADTLNAAKDYTDSKIQKIDDEITSSYFDTSLWEQGMYYTDDGTRYDGTTGWIRTIDYLSDNILYVAGKTTYRLICLAWNNGTYIGAYRASDGAFVKTGVSSTQEINIKSIKDSHPSYSLKLCAKNNDSATITVEESENIIFLGLNYATRTELKNSIETQTKYTDEEILKNTHTNIPAGGQIVYVGDTSAETAYIQNAVAYKDGTFIACRSNGKIVKVDYSGQETELLSISGSKMDWRLCWMDSNENVYVSPHGSWGTVQQAQRGLYRLAKGGNSFVKVINLYDPNSEITTETQENDDTIWTMCEDNAGNLYAGVYAHTVRANPAIYKSTDGGITWSYLINFNTAGYTANGMHIHSIIFSKWQNALYCIVGEINTIFKSIDGGTTWTNLHITLDAKGSAMIATEQGIFIGSDGTLLRIDWLLNDDKTVENVFKGWGNTVFGMRRSDVTGFLYACTKIDSSVNNTNMWPPATVLDGTTTIQEWQNSVSTGSYNTWLKHYNEVYPYYPEDAVRPQHYGLLVSRDGGKTWDVLTYVKCLSTAANGFWCMGQFFNGEVLVGRQEDYEIKNPMIVSEGRHKYVSGGCDLSGDVFVRLNSSTTVSVI